MNSYFEQTKYIHQNKIESFFFFNSFESIDLKFCLETNDANKQKC